MSRPNEELATVEQRARAVRYWTDVVRPQMAAKESAKAPESPDAAVARIKAEGWGDLKVSDAVRATLPGMTRGAAA